MVPANCFNRNTVLLLLVAFVFSLGSCAPAVVETPMTPSATAVIPTAKPTTSPTETLVPTNTPVPTDTSMPFVPKATIKIAVHVPLSGDYSSAGTDLLRAAEFAVEQLAEPLNELGYKIELVSYDDQMDIGAAVANINEIVADPDVLCGVGNYASRITIQTSEIYHKNGLAFISPSNTVPNVTDRGYLEVNRVVGREDGVGIAGAQFAKAQGYTSVYIIAPTWSDSIFRKHADYFKREADRIGVKVVGMLNTDVADDFEGIVKRMMGTNPDLVFFASHAYQAAPFFRQARAAGYMGAFLGVEDDPAVAELAGPLLVDGGGMYIAYPAAPAMYYPDAEDFVQEFDMRFGTVPQMFAAQAYDATGICMKAIEEASRAKGGELPARAEVANMIRALQDYKGITGTYNFNKKGDPDPAQYFVFQVVSPDPNNWDQNIVVASFEIPPPK